MRHNSVLALNPQGFHRIHYHEWGAEENTRVLICVHGVGRNSRDFDEIGQALSRDFRVVCPDIAGRGRSDWLPAAQHYRMPQYLSDMTTLIARLGVEQVHWLGTSMGGLIGICLAAMANTPIQSLVLNDVGPFISKEALQRINTYLSSPPVFNSLKEVELYYRALYPAFQGLSDKQWQRLALQGSRETESGFKLHYDPAIAASFSSSCDSDVDLWAVWAQVSCPQLLPVSYTHLTLPTICSV